MNEREAALLRQRVAHLERLVEQLMQPKSVARIFGGVEEVRLCKNGASTIAARSGSTLSSQSCTVYTATSGTLASTSSTITVYNLSTEAVAANAYIIAALISGIWIAVWEDC